MKRNWTSPRCGTYWFRISVFTSMKILSKSTVPLYWFSKKRRFMIPFPPCIDRANILARRTLGCHHDCDLVAHVRPFQTTVRRRKHFLTNVSPPKRKSKNPFMNACAIILFVRMPQNLIVTSTRTKRVVQMQIVVERQCHLKTNINSILTIRWVKNWKHICCHGWLGEHVTMTLVEVFVG